MPELFAIVKVWILDRPLQKYTSGKNWELHLVAPPHIKTRFDKTMNAYNVLQRKILRLLKAKECVDFEQCYTETWGKLHPIKLKDPIHQMYLSIYTSKFTLLQDS